MAPRETCCIQRLNNWVLLLHPFVSLNSSHRIQCSGRGAASCEDLQPGLSCCNQEKWWQSCCCCCTVRRGSSPKPPNFTNTAHCHHLHSLNLSVSAREAAVGGARGERNQRDTRNTLQNTHTQARSGVHTELLHGCDVFYHVPAS